MVERSKAETYKAVNTTIEEAEPGRRYKHDSPEEHLLWLLNIGWDVNSPLIQRYIRKNNLCQPERQKE